MEENTPIGYVYITENLVNGKRYIGQHQAKEFDKNYLGSGVVFLKALKKYGKKNFQVKIIEWGNSLEDLNKKEIYWIDYYNAARSEDFYNVSLGGGGFLMTDEMKEINRQTQKIVQCHPDVVEKKRKALLGKKLPKESCLKMSIKQKEIQNRKEQRELRRLQNLGNNRAGKPVVCIETHKIYKSSLDAARSFGKNDHSAIAYCARRYQKGGSNTAYGFHWRYYQEDIDGEVCF